jgi:STE24 endopeptidase
VNVYAIVILAALFIEYALSVVSAVLTVRSLDPALPPEFHGVFDAGRYARSQQYTRSRVTFGLVRATAGLAVVLAWWLSGGFNWLDQVIRGIGRGPVISGLLYIGALVFASAVLGLPFRIYSTFVIEQRHGFNRTSLATFVSDLAKGLSLAVLFGGVLLAVVLLFFERAGPLAWLWCWGVVTILALGVQFVAPTWIMPLFNTFRPLQSGELREAILACATSTGFPLHDIFVVDGSRRSSKANAFFTGLGRNRRIGLFDTLVERHSVPELVAIVAHEIGHYKLRHILKNAALGIAHLGAVFFVLSLFLSQSGLFDAFYMEERSVYAGLVFFGLLFTPVDLALSMVLNAVSRRHEFEADAFAAKATGNGEPLILALKTLSADNLTNLTPHPLHVFLHDSHPPVTQRILRLRALTPIVGHQ